MRWNYRGVLHFCERLGCSVMSVGNLDLPETEEPEKFYFSACPHCGAEMMMQLRENALRVKLFHGGDMFIYG